MSTASTSNMIVVTQIQRRIKYLLPSPDGTNRGDTCSRGGPLCVGAAQIIVALVIFGFGFFLAFQFQFSNSSAYVWAPLIFIAAGCFTMAAGWTAKSILVRAALRINVAAAVVAFITFIIFLIGIVLSNDNTDPFAQKPNIGVLYTMSPFLPFSEMALSCLVAQRCCRHSCGQQPIITIEQQYETTSGQASPPYSP